MCVILTFHRKETDNVTITIEGPFFVGILLSALNIVKAASVIIRQKTCFFCFLSVFYINNSEVISSTFGIVTYESTNFEDFESAETSFFMTPVIVFNSN